MKYFNKSWISKVVLLLCFQTLGSCTKSLSQIHLVIKIPTKSRTELFFKRLDQYYNLLSGKVRTTFLITCDLDDAAMNTPAVKNRLDKYSNLIYMFGHSKSKIEACNADMNLVPDFDIVLMASDDMEPNIKDYDLIIAETMLTHFPDFSGVLNFNDGHQKENLNTYPIIGKKFYNQFGYIYYPSYKSFFCDEELTLVAHYLKKSIYRSDIILYHKHYLFKQGQFDAIYKKNSQHFFEDKKMFEERKRKNFDLPN